MTFIVVVVVVVKKYFRWEGFVGKVSFDPGVTE